jgi:hypothetical protein
VVFVGVGLGGFDFANEMELKTNKHKLIQQAHNILDCPFMIGNPCLHRWRDAESLMDSSGHSDERGDPVAQYTVKQNLTREVYRRRDANDSARTTGEA